MNRSLSALVALLGGAGAAMSGYAKGKSQFQQNERQKTLDAREDEDYTFKKGERDRQVEIRQGVADAQADVGVKEIPSYDVSNMAGEAPAGTPPAGYEANGQTFAGRADADSAIIGLNSRAEKAKRTAAYLASKGEDERARKYEDFARQALSEGTDQILGAIASAAPRVEDVKKAGGMVAGTIGAGAAEAFNSVGGKWKVTPDTVVQHFIDRDAAGREIVNSRVLGKDGKPVVEDVRGAGMMLMSMKERMAQANDDTRTYLTAEQQKEGARHNKATEEGQAADRQSAAAARAAQTAQGWAQIGIARQKAALEAQSLKKQSPEGQIATLENIIGEKLSVEDKKRYLGITKGTAGKNTEQELADDLTKKGVETGQLTTPGQIAQFRQELSGKFADARANLPAEDVLKKALGAHKPNTPEYAAEYQNARTAKFVIDPAAPGGKRGMTEAELAARGFVPPTATKARTVPNPVAMGTQVAQPPVRQNPQYAPFAGTPRTTGQREAQQVQAAQQERAAQAAILQRNIMQLERTLTSSTGNAQFQQQAAARLARYKAELAKLDPVAAQ